MSDQESSERQRPSFPIAFTFPRYNPLATLKPKRRPTSLITSCRAQLASGNFSSPRHSIAYRDSNVGGTYVRNSRNSSDALLPSDSLPSSANPTIALICFGVYACSCDFHSAASDIVIMVGDVGLLCCETRGRANTSGAHLRVISPLNWLTSSSPTTKTALYSRSSGLPATSIGRLST